MNREKTKAFFSYVLPSVLAFALSGVYTIVDGFFIGQRLGDAGLAAITLAYPVSALLGAIGTGIGLSGAIRFAILDAQGEEKKRQECFGATALLLIVTAALLTAVLFGFSRPVMRLLGAQDDLLTLAVDYSRVIALGAVFHLSATGFVPFIRNMGGASFAMTAMILGFLTNIVLDYTFVWVIDAGMAGAAWATILGQAVTMLAAVLFFARKKSCLSLPRGRELASLWKRILQVGLSPFGLTFSPTLTMLFMNRFLLLYENQKDVAVYGCIGYIVSILYLLLQGVGDGSQPLISRHYGENDLVSVKEYLRLTYSAAGALTLVCVIAVYLARTRIGVLFGTSPEANTEVARYLPYFLATLLFLAYVRITTSYFYATEKTALSYVLVYAEPVCTLLALIVLPLGFGLTGVWLACPTAQAITFVIALVAKRSTDKKAA